MPSDRPSPPSVKSTSLTALPSPAARLGAVIAIVVGSLLGGVIGWALVDLQIDEQTELAKFVGALIGGVIAAIGMTVISILVLRAMAEWRTGVRLD